MKRQIFKRLMQMYRGAQTFTLCGFDCEKVTDRLIFIKEKAPCERRFFGFFGSVGLTGETFFCRKKLSTATVKGVLER